MNNKWMLGGKYGLRAVYNLAIFYLDKADKRDPQYKKLFEIMEKCLKALTARMKEYSKVCFTFYFASVV